MISLSVKQGLSLTIMVCLLASQFYVAKIVIPEKEWFEHIGQPNYETLMPEQFGNWVRLKDNYTKITLSPEVEEKLNELYSSTVNRIYKNTLTQNIIMVSLAYGNDQMFPNQVHRPDACYPSQGFKISDRTSQTRNYKNTPLLVNTLVATRQLRTENVIYWIRMGNGLVSSTMNMHYNRIYLAANGYKADGLLFRVSEISNDSLTSFDVQFNFIDDFLDSLSVENRKFFLGGF